MALNYPYSGMNKRELERMERYKAVKQRRFLERMKEKENANNRRAQEMLRREQQRQEFFAARRASIRESREREIREIAEAADVERRERDERFRQLVRRDEERRREQERAQMERRQNLQKAQARESLERAFVGRVTGVNYNKVVDAEEAERRQRRIDREQRIRAEFNEYSEEGRRKRRVNSFASSEINGVLIDTCRSNDYFETEIYHPYYSKDWIILEVQATEILANFSHNRWVKVFGKGLPPVLIDVDSIVYGKISSVSFSDAGVAVKGDVVSVDKDALRVKRKFDFK